MRFNISRVGDYASHNLSIWHGECPHGCKYCYVRKIFGRYNWARGDYRLNPKALKQCKFAELDDVKCLVIQFSADPLPLANSKRENMEILGILLRHLDFLEQRGVNTKVLTKNALIRNIVRFTDPYEHIQLGMSITTNSYNTKETQFWEPGIHSINHRLNALEILNEVGFSTWVSMEPILPRTNITQAILETVDTGVKEIWVGKGSYNRRLESAFHWGDVARQVQDLSLPQVHLKKELRQFLKKKSLKQYLY